MPEKQFVLGIDIGGQTVKLGLYEVVHKGSHDAKLNSNDVWIYTEETKKGINPHCHQIVDVIGKAVVKSDELGGKVVGVGVASPGRFGIDGVIKPGSNPNVESFAKEFDNINLRGEYVRAMQELHPELLSIPFSVRNDGNAMLAGMISSIQSLERPDMFDHRGDIVKPHCVTGRYVGLIGLGTGLGHAIAYVDTDTHYHFVTDGHASKLRIAVDAEDLPLVKQGAAILKEKSGKDEVVMFADGTIRAEDLCRSPMVNAMAGVKAGSDINTANNEQHRKVAQLVGKYIARIMIAIHSGENEDIDPDNSWSAADKKEAAKTSLYLFGGGLGRSPLGAEIMRYTEKELDNNHIHDIRMVQIPDVNVAAYAAAIMAFDTLTIGI